MRTIPLTQDRFAIVDDTDYDWLMAYSWHAHRDKTRENCFIARTNVYAGWHKQRVVLMHRLILQAPAHLIADHINFDTLDNRRCNLRLCNVVQSNAHKRAWGSRIGCYKGVQPWGNKFKAALVHKGESFYLGLFATPELAAKAYDDKARAIYGEFAHPNL
jgi:AP2 domain.